MNPAPALLACILLMIPAETSRAQQANPASASSSASSSASAAPAPPVSADEIRRLVLQLADPDFATREAAAARLQQIGKPALPALKEAAADSDPEIRTRAAALVRRLERRPLPGGPLDRVVRGPQRHIFGDRRITIDEGDRQFEIAKTDDDGIRITVTALVNGERVTEIYTARDAAELKEQEPEAYAVFERWGEFLVSGLQLGGGQFVFRDRLVQVRDELDELRDQLQEQMIAKRLPAARVNDVMAQLDRLQAIRRGQVVIAPAEADRHVKEYFRLSDLLRNKLAELKLDAGDALPPPPNQRLGVQISLNADPITGDVDGVIVQLVVTDSRAAKIGLKPADHIRRINDTPVRSTQDIREALAKAKDELVIEVVRDGKTIKLTEKAEAK